MEGDSWLEQMAWCNTLGGGRASTRFMPVPESEETVCVWWGSGSAHGGNEQDLLARLEEDDEAGESRRPAEEAMDLFRY